MHQEHRIALKALLRERAERVRELETRAGRTIEQDHDQAGYAALMRAKAELLADLHDDCRALLDGATPDEARRIEAFSRSAGNSLDVGSVFYMSALLYPEDHRPGQPNDLERFADAL
ncbi:MAG: hypothetical protein AB7D57_06835 [Desulfovibrionaceae bacterium]